MARQQQADGHCRIRTLCALQATDWDRGSLLCFRSFSIPDVPPFETIRQPVVIIQGSEDPATKASSARQVSRLEASREMPSSRCCCRQHGCAVPLNDVYIAPCVYPFILCKR